MDTKLCMGVHLTGALCLNCDNCGRSNQGHAPFTEPHVENSARKAYQPVVATEHR